MMAVRGVFLLLCLSYVHAFVWNLDCHHVREFVEGHNSRRLQLAKGKVHGQPAASRMTSLVWDEELAKKAADWAGHNKFQHNPDRTIPSRRFRTGENLYYYSTTDKHYNFKLDAALKDWFNEHKDYKYKTMGWDDFNGPEIGHYTQMIWADTTYVGCAVSQYPEGDYTTYLVVCDYGPAGNMIGEKPYESGNPSNELVCGARDCNRLYGSRC